MRIGFYAPLKPPDHPQPSGDRRMARLMMQALAAAGHEVKLLSRLRSYDGAGDDAVQRQQASEGAAEAARILADSSFRPELVFTYHVYHKAPDHLGPAVARHFGVPYVIAEPSVAPKRANGPWAFAYEAANRAIAAADLLLCLTRHDMALVERFAATRERVRYLPPFLDTAPFAALSKPAKPGKTCRLLAVAMMRTGAKTHSFLQLAEALALLRQHDWQLLIAGDGETRAEIGAAFAPFGARVAFLGRVSEAEMPALMASCDLMPWPAVDEAYGMALLEAQCAGLPVLAVGHRGVPDVVFAPEGAMLVPAWNAAAFARALDDLIADAPRRAAMGQAARQRALAERGLGPAAKNLAAMLQGL